MDVNERLGFVAVHVGAGYHSPANSDTYKKVCQQACLKAVELLRQNKSSVEAVVAAIESLEDSPWTNAGKGSNLTVEGTVECDASLMDGKSLQYAAVGAVAGVKNPITVAHNLLVTQLQGTMSLGRVPPCTLVGKGAYDWAAKHKLATITEKDELITDSSRRAYLKHKRKLDTLEESKNDLASLAKNARLDRDNSGSEISSRADALQDTVGAICVDRLGNVSSAVSSGGIILKQPGRVGQAAVYGCGCWAENDLDSGLAVGVSTSGCGEQLVKTLFARECADCLKYNVNEPAAALGGAFTDKFLGSPYLRSTDQKLGGVLALLVDSCSQSSSQAEVLWGHTTDSMCLAYMSTTDTAAKALVSRLPEGKCCGRSFVVQSNLVVSS